MKKQKNNLVYKLFYYCDVHGMRKVRATIILNDKVESTVILSVCCPVCYNFKKKLDEQKKKS